MAERLSSAGHGLRMYALIVGMWLRSTMAYRTSFLLMTLGSAGFCFLDFLAIMLMFTHIEMLAGFALGEMALLYASTSASLGLADLLLGTMNRVGTRVRDGTMDTLLVRPVPVFAQLAADRFALHRIGRLLPSSLVLGWALTQLDAVAWTPWEALLLPVMVLSGAALYGALFTLGGAFQFWAQDAAEVQNAFTYGGNTLLHYPPTVFATELVRAVVFIMPLAFVNWLPALYLLDRELPLGLPTPVAFLSPAVALVCCAGAALVWRAGLRGYRSTGS